MDSNEQVAREIVGEYKQRIAQLPSDGIVPCEKWLAKRLEILLDLHTAALAKQGSPLELPPCEDCGGRDFHDAICDYNADDGGSRWPVKDDQRAKQGSPPKEPINWKEYATRYQRVFSEILGTAEPYNLGDCAILIGKKIEQLEAEIRRLQVSPPADTVERAREIVRTPFPHDPDRPSDPDEYTERWLVKLTERISAALVEKDAKIQRLHDEIAELAHTVATHSDKIVEQGQLNRMIEGVFGSQEDAVREKEREVWDKAIEGVRKLRDEWQEKQGDWDKHTMGMVDSAVHIIAALEAARTSEKEK